MWFLLDNARALKEMGRFGDALKLCHEVQQVSDWLCFYINNILKVM